MEEPRVEVGESGMTLDELVDEIIEQTRWVPMSYVEITAEFDLTWDEADMVIEECKHRIRERKHA